MSFSALLQGRLVRRNRVVACAGNSCGIILFFDVGECNIAEPGDCTSFCSANQFFRFLLLTLRTISPTRRHKSFSQLLSINAAVIERPNQVRGVISIGNMLGEHLPLVTCAPTLSADLSSNKNKVVPVSPRNAAESASLMSTPLSALSRLLQSILN